MVTLTMYLLGDMAVMFNMGWGISFFLMLIMLLNLNDLYSYEFSLDFISYMMILLTFLIMSYMYNTLKGDSTLGYKMGGFYMFLMSFTLLVVFLTLDSMIFYFSFEFVVVPIFLMVLIMGSSMERLQSAIYLFLYTLISSMPFLVFMIFFFSNMGGLSFSSFFYWENFGGYWWAFVILVFLVKLPVFLVHLWLPSAHVEAPLVGSMILAGVLLKLGGYGLFKMQLFVGDSFWFCSSFYIFLGVYGGLVMCLVCVSQVDMKSLIAYSSIVHMGPVLCGILSYSWMGWWGSFMIMLSHGLCSSGMFYILSLLYERLGSRSMLVLSGLNLFLPFLSYFWFFLASCNMSVPPTFNFYSELVFMVGILSMGLLVKLVFGFMFLMVGVYNIFFFVVVNHSVTMHYLLVSYVLSKSEMAILLYHCFPLIAFPAFFTLF